MKRPRRPLGPPPEAVSLPPAPPALWPLVRRVGEDAALALIEARGGTSVYVPHRLPEPPDEHPLVAALGEALARQLVRDLAGDYLDVPVGRPWLILIYHGRGMSYAEIARSLRCSQDTVWRVLNAAELTGRQGDLFAR